MVAAFRTDARHLRRRRKIFSSSPDERLRVTAVTGTNGKTTSTLLIDSILRASGAITGLVGTVEYHLAGRVLPAVNTTPESLDLFRMMSELEGAGGTHFTLEASSHALDLGRFHGVAVHTAGFTNFTRDHLDYHGTMEAYFDAKQLLFLPRSGPPPRFAVLNTDDEASGAASDCARNSGLLVRHRQAPPAVGHRRRLGETQRRAVVV